MATYLDLLAPKPDSGHQIAMAICDKQIGLKTDQLKFPKKTAQAIKDCARTRKRLSLGLEPIKNLFVAYAAHHLYMDHSPGAERWIIEALLIDGCNYKEIANALQIDSKVLRQYENCYFYLPNQQLRKLYAAKIAHLADTGYTPNKKTDWGYKLIASTHGWGFLLKMIFCPEEASIVDQIAILQAAQKTMATSFWNNTMLLQNTNLCKSEPIRQAIALSMLQGTAVNSQLKTLKEQEAANDQNSARLEKLLNSLHSDDEVMISVDTAMTEFEDKLTKQLEE